MVVSEWMGGVLFGGIWLLIALGNWAALYRVWRHGGSTSLVLFIGALFGMLAIAALPLEGAWGWLWVPLLLDPGELFALLAMLWAGWRGRRPGGPTG